MMPRAPVPSVRRHLLGLTVLAALAGCQENTPLVSNDGEVADAEGTAVATFAGGCFWCVEADLEKVDGVLSAVSGFMGGHVENPDYDEVWKGRTGHAESVQVRFDPNRVRYTDLLEVFWRSIDPTDADGQFADRGTAYRPVIFVHDDQQRQSAEASKQALIESERFFVPVVVPIEAATRFWPADDYHQDYYKKSPEKYLAYRRGSGRDAFLDRVWGDERHYQPEPITADELRDAGRPFWVAFQKPSEDVLRERLTDLQYRVTQDDATERAFENTYWDNKQDGIYVDIVSGEPLFSSLDKYKSGTGWPSFFRPIEDGVMRTDTDFKLLYPRTELRSRYGDSHLGHVFDDGPAPTGKRYCINSAALRFIPVDQLEAEGYGRFLERFERESGR